MATMAAAFTGPITALQIGTTFAGQYYHFLQQQPFLVHQFYTDASTVVRIDGATGETAIGVMQIHSLVMSLQLSGIEIKSTHSLDSWAGGVLVMVSGSVLTKDYNARRKFVQTFFLAPQEKGYFVLNDIFEFIHDEQILQHPTTLAHDHFVANLDAAKPIAEPVSDYMMRGEVQAHDFDTPVQVEENATVDKYSISEPQKQVSECLDRVGETAAEDLVVSSPIVMNTTRDPTPASATEPVDGPPRQTYASIVRVAKSPLGNSVSQPASLNKATSVASGWHQTSPSSSQLSHPIVPMGYQKSNLEAVEDDPGLEDEGDAKSLYVGNLPPSVSVLDLEREFMNFGKVKHNGIAVRNRKDSTGYYAFVEFEDALGVQNALKASPIQINGQKVHFEERKSSSNASRAGRRGRGRGGYQSEGPRGRFNGRGFNRASPHENGREYNNRSRGNGFYSRFPQQERGILGIHHVKTSHSQVADS
ncbi:nuclear transport factor 2-like [Dioscorea cayenensis subsp. rotundata]|uniref:Nuclear transport factor 2-like n=1 Tax=Dioscorea cayennensis subsp. rotundata TaxID=55577 RepID=A0AB40AQ34_DIOCR|nr:nuclear transport factor 2-like [Dioscorea cayenensis subsp. rotundata]